MSIPYSTFSFHTLGCKLNYSESSYLANQLIERGYSQVDINELADIYIINTCSVTDNADNKAKRLINKLNNQSPSAVIVIIGCYAQLKPDEIRNIKGVNLVLSTDKKFNLIKYLEKISLYSQLVEKDDISKTKNFNLSFSSGTRTRSYLKIQDGCNYICSYCTIPKARGLSRSGDINEIINIIFEITKLGVNEIVLTGVNIGDFYSDNNESFIDLVKELDLLRDIPRIRISSIEPNLLTAELIEFIISSKNFVPHFHIPLQSGSNKILKSMKRRYDKELYHNRIKHIRNISANACIGADVITGFPSETNSDFFETVNFIETLDINYLHVFPYSEREGTKSVDISGKVSTASIKNRSKQLRKISLIKKKNFLKRNVGKIQEVLFESFDNGVLSGFSENYIRVNVNGKKELLNSVLPVKINNTDNTDAYGEIIS